MKTLLFFCGLIISAPSISQEIKFQQEIGWKGIEGPISLATFHNADKSLTCVTLIQFDSLKAFLLDKNMKLIKTTSVFVPSDDEYLGGFIRDNRISFLFNRIRGRQIVNLVYNIDSNSFRDFFMPFDLKGKKILGHTGVGKFYYLTAEKKEPVINVFEFTNDGKVLQQDYDLSNVSGTHLNRNQLWQSRSGDADIAIVETEADCSIRVANAPNKIYYRNDTLLLLMDKEIGRTDIFSFDLAHKKLDYRKIERNGMMPANTALNFQCVYNSFLSEDKLYYIYATEQNLFLTINDFSSGKELQRLIAGREGEISFKNTAILRDGGSNRELVKTKQFLNKLLSGRAVIIAYQNQYNQYEITVGAYIESRSGGSMSASGAFSGGGDITWSIFRFKSLFDTKTLEHISGEMKPSLPDFLDNYTKDIKIPSAGKSLFTIDNNFYYSYYDKEKRNLVILKL